MVRSLFFAFCSPPVASFSVAHVAFCRSCCVAVASLFLQEDLDYGGGLADILAEPSDEDIPVSSGLYDDVDLEEDQKSQASRVGHLEGFSCFMNIWSPRVPFSALLTFGMGVCSSRSVFLILSYRAAARV